MPGPRAVRFAPHDFDLALVVRNQDHLASEGIVQ
jgi:hypothetical protein